MYMAAYLVVSILSNPVLCHKEETGHNVTDCTMPQGKYGDKGAKVAQDSSYTQVPGSLMKWMKLAQLKVHCIWVAPS